MSAPRTAGRQLSQRGELNPAWRRAENGNIALAGEIDLAQAPGGRFLLALGFGERPEEAAHHALAGLQNGFADAHDLYLDGWRRWQAGLLPLDGIAGSGATAYRISTAVLASHQTIEFPGATIASLSIPWGFHKGDEDLGGYHLVWPRDLVETAGGFLAAGAVAEAKAILGYLQAIQEADGHWSQNVWLDGTPYWNGVQMDECAFPILLADMLRREGGLAGDELARFVPMVRRAAGFILRNGPVTGQDRWEEDAGYSPFTLAVEIAALLAAADILEPLERRGSALAARDRRHLERRGRALDLRRGHRDLQPARPQGLLCPHRPGRRGGRRLAARRLCAGEEPAAGRRCAQGRPADQPGRAGPGALRPARRRTIRASSTRCEAIDAVLKAELPQGPVWYRYNDDGYGEHADGAPFDGTGIGRAWPLLTGERAHYELAAGRHQARRRRCWRRWSARPGRAGCCRSRCGTPTTCRSASCSAAGPRAAPCRWSGRIPSTSSCCARCATDGCSTCRRSRCSATSSTR